MSQIPGLGNYNAQRFSQHVPSISVSDADEALANSHTILGDVHMNTSLVQEVSDEETVYPATPNLTLSENSQPSTSTAEITRSTQIEVVETTRVTLPNTGLPEPEKTSNVLKKLNPPSAPLNESLLEPPSQALPPVNVSPPDNVSPASDILGSISLRGASPDPNASIPYNPPPPSVTDIIGNINLRGIAPDASLPAAENYCPSPDSPSLPLNGSPRESPRRNSSSPTGLLVQPILPRSVERLSTQQDVSPTIATSQRNSFSRASIGSRTLASPNNVRQPAAQPAVGLNSTPQNASQPISSVSLRQTVSPSPSAPHPEISTSPQVVSRTLSVTSPARAIQVSIQSLNQSTAPTKDVNQRSVQATQDSAVTSFTQAAIQAPPTAQPDPISQTQSMLQALPRAPALASARSKSHLCNFTIPGPPQIQCNAACVKNKLRCPQHLKLATAKCQYSSVKKAKKSTETRPCKNRVGFDANGNLATRCRIHANLARFP